MVVTRLGILLVFAFMLGGCVTMDTRDQLREGMSKSDLESVLNLTTTIWDDPFISPVSEWSADQQTEILYAEGRKYFYVFTDVTQQTSGERIGNGRLHSVHTNIDAARRVVRALSLARVEAARPKTKRASDQREIGQKTNSKKKKIRPLE